MKDFNKALNAIVLRFAGSENYFKINRLASIAKTVFTLMSEIEDYVKSIADDIENITYDKRTIETIIKRVQHSLKEIEEVENLSIPNAQHIIEILVMAKEPLDFELRRFSMMQVLNEPELQEYDEVKGDDGKSINLLKSGVLQDHYKRLRDKE